MINPDNDNAAVDSSVVKTCKDTTTQRRRKNKKYKEPESLWGYSTMGYEYGRKVHAVMDTDSLSVMEDNHCICIWQEYGIWNDWLCKEL